jgi:rhodanese-related sulfurtransferase
VKPQRVAVKLFAAPDPSVPVPLEGFVPLFHRFIQQGRLEGLLVDVADYAHVPDGPGVVLIGHEVDYAIDRTGGRTGLLVTRKRCGSLPLAESLRDALRKALIAARAIEAEFGGGIRFAADGFEIRLVDRLAAPNDGAGFAAARAEIAPVVEKLWGDAGCELKRVADGDARRPLGVGVAARAPIDAGALLERLGGEPARAAAQSPWDLDVEDLHRLRETGADFLLVDVRERHEYEICNLGGELVPLGTLSGRLVELDREAHIVVHCKGGGRGAKAVAALREAGFANAWNLRGGILAWIDRIDPSLTRY